MSKKVVQVTDQMKNVKFIHCRNVDEDGKVMAKGGMTIAYILDSARKVVGFAAAKCHINDTFNKHQGRAKAGGRLRSSRYYEHCPEPIEEDKFITQTLSGYARVFLTSNL